MPDLILTDGEVFTDQITITDAVEGGPTDPATVQFTYQVGAQPPVTWVYATNAQISKVSTGVYSVELPTLGMTNDGVTINGFVTVAYSWLTEGPEDSPNVGAGSLRNFFRVQRRQLRRQV